MKNDISEFFGVLSDLTEKEIEEIKKGMKLFRKSVDKDFNERIKRNSKYLKD